MAYKAKTSPATGVYFSKNRCLNVSGTTYVKEGKFWKTPCPDVVILDLPRFCNILYTKDTGI